MAEGPQRVTKRPQHLEEPTVEGAKRSRMKKPRGYKSIHEWVTPEEILVKVVRIIEEWMVNSRAGGQSQLWMHLFMQGGGP